jgi:hypothetical protein
MGMGIDVHDDEDEGEAYCCSPYCRLRWCCSPGCAIVVAARPKTNNIRAVVHSIVEMSLSLRCSRSKQINPSSRWKSHKSQQYAIKMRGWSTSNSRADDPFYSKKRPFWTRVAAA